MRAVVAPAVALFLCAACGGRERPPSETIEGANGATILVSPIGHGTVQVSSGADIVLVDPAKGHNYDGLPRPTVILVTHDHDDHFNLQMIAERRMPMTSVFVSRNVGSRVPAATTLRNGEQKTAGGISVEAVAMYNPVGEVFHAKGAGNGYVVTLAGKRIYFAGDTGCTNEMKALRDIDIAFLPMNMPYTMAPTTAAECARAFRPKIVYPYHYLGNDPQQFVDAMAGSALDVRLRKW